MRPEGMFVSIRISGSLLNLESIDPGVGVLVCCNPYTTSIDISIISAPCGDERFPTLYSLF